MEVIKKSNKSLNFIGKVRMGDGRVEINPQNDPGTRYKFARADVPKYIKKGTFFVSLSEDGSEIFAVRPYEGTFRGKFKNFFTKENEIPKPFKREAKPVAFEGKSFTVPEHLEFTCNFILTQDDYEDMPVAGYFWYDYFKEDKKGNLKVEGGGQQFDKVVALLDSHGLLDRDIEYEDNLLPVIGKLLRKARREIMINIKKGYAVGFSEIPESLDDEDDDLLADDDLDDDDDLPEPDTDEEDELEDDDDIPF